MKRVTALFHVIDDLRSVGQLGHVKRRDVPQSYLHAFLRTSRRDATDGVRRALGNVGSAVDGIDGNVKFRRTGIPRAELFAF